MVDVTVSGDVPVAIFEINLGAVILAVANTCAVFKFPTLALPLTLNVPVMFAPVPVTTRIFALPDTEILTSPSAVGMLTFELPFVIELPVAAKIFDSRLPSP